MKTEKSTALLTENDNIANEDKLSEHIDKLHGEELEEDSRCMSEVTRKTILGLIIVILLAVSWVGAQQFSQSAVASPDFYAPYFVTWYSTCWMMFCYPGYVLFVAITEAFNKEDYMFKKEIRDSLNIFGETKITVVEFFTKVVSMNILWVAVNYMYLYGLGFIAATDASAIMASNVAFVYILSLFLLKENFYAIRLIASVFCIAGIVLISYADGFGGGTTPGILLCLASAIGAAVYKVIFKVLVGSASLGQVSLFLSLLGFSNAAFLWSIFLILYFTGVDVMTADSIPWQFINISAILGLVFNFLVNFGIAFTYPLFISIAMMVGVPLNAGVDIIVKDVVFDIWRLVGALVIIIGFGLMLLPDEWNDPIHNLFGCKCKRRSDQEDISLNEIEA